jgi:hypothetical protein
MPGPKRARRERTEEWASIKQWTLWPEQELYEQIRPIILFGETAGERAKEMNAAQRTLSRKADEFKRYGMRSLFSDHAPREEAETARSLPLDLLCWLLRISVPFLRHLWIRQGQYDFLHTWFIS